MKKEKEPTDRERLAFLAKCEKIDRTAQDGGWAFELLVFNLDRKVPPVDIRLAFRGRSTRLPESLIEAVDGAISITKDGIENE